MDTDVVVVGGGLAGLLTATALRSSGIEDLIVVESGAAAGGVARTIHDGGYRLEPAAGTLMLPHPHLGPLLTDAGVSPIPTDTIATTRFVHARGRLFPVHASPRMLASGIVGWGAKARGLAEPLVRRRRHGGEETLADLLIRRFGRGVGSLVSELAASGVFAGDAHRLSASASFPTLGALEDEAGSLVRAVLRRRRRADGMERPSPHVADPDMAALADGLAAPLGERFQTGVTVDQVYSDASAVVVDGSVTLRARHVVLSCRPSSAAMLVGGSAGDLLTRETTAPVAVVWLAGPSDAVSLPHGFGVLVASHPSHRVLGILFESSYAPHRAPEGHGLAKVIVGGARNPDVVTLDDDQLATIAVDEVSDVLGTRQEPHRVRVVRHIPGIPQYGVGHGSWVDEIEATLPGEIHLAGWGYRGVGLTHIAGDAVRIAARIAQ